MIKLYSTGCPKCNVLKLKMNAKGIEFKEITDIEVLKQMNLQSVPYLQIDDEELMDFSKANEWINNK